MSGQDPIDLRVDVGGVVLQNPVLLASGPFGYGGRYPELLDLSLLGGVILKGTAPVAWPGNPPPRLVPIEGGLVNAIGLENPGIDAVLRGPVPALRAQGAKLILNVVGHNPSEMAEVAARASDCPDLVAIELNLSCPNVPDGLAFGTDPRATALAVTQVRASCRLALWVKLPPSPPDRVGLATAALEAGADALSLVNTLPVAAKRPDGKLLWGGLSGAALRPLALRAVAEVAAAWPKVPIIASGGIASAEDALTFLSAGARAIAIGTALFANPLAPIEILHHMREAAVRTSLLSPNRGILGA